jgi:hypothetical protein
MLYLASHHQSANPAMPMVAVMAVEINNETAANLIHSVTVHNFQSAPRFCLWSYVPFAQHADAFFIGALTPQAAVADCINTACPSTHRRARPVSPGDIPKSHQPIGGAAVDRWT